MEVVADKTCLFVVVLTPLILCGYLVSTARLLEKATLVLKSHDTSTFYFWLSRIDISYDLSLVISSF